MERTFRTKELLKRVHAAIIAHEVNAYCATLEGKSKSERKASEDRTIQRIRDVFRDDSAAELQEAAEAFGWDD